MEKRKKANLGARRGTPPPPKKKLRKKVAAGLVTARLWPVNVYRGVQQTNSKVRQASPGKVLFTMFNRQPETPDSQSLFAPEQTGMKLAGEGREAHSESDIAQFRMSYALENVDGGCQGSHELSTECWCVSTFCLHTCVLWA